MDPSAAGLQYAPDEMKTLSCICKQKALYCLRRANIPINIFSKIECEKSSCRKLAGGCGCYVSCFLCPDKGLTGLENFNNWPTTYHGTTPEVVRSILEHGQLLMRGDYLYNGRQIQRRCGEDDWENAIFTNPRKVAAEVVATLGESDEGRTEFVVLLRLRQEPETYTVKPGLGFGGHELWSTNRRGTIYIEGLEVLVHRAKAAVTTAPMLMSLKDPGVSPFTCPIQRQAFTILESLNIPKSLLDSRANECYCAKCHWSVIRVMDVAGQRCSIPLGWTLFGLAVNPVTEKLNNIGKLWHTAYHGCRPDSVAAIIKTRELLIRGDILPDGSIIQNNYDTWQESDYFLSPEIKYASHVWYASPRKFTTLYNTTRCFQTVLLFKVRPGSFETKRDTEIEDVQLCTDYSVVGIDEMEWYSQLRGCVRPYGLLIRTLDVSNLEELKKAFSMPHEMLTEDIFC